MISVTWGTSSKQHAFHAVGIRANMAKPTIGKLHEFWASTILDEPTKLRLYKCAV